MSDLLEIFIELKEKSKKSKLTIDKEYIEVLKEYTHLGPKIILTIKDQLYINV